MTTWNMSPQNYCEQARAKAIANAHLKNPKLTALERAYWKAYKSTRL